MLDKDYKTLLHFSEDWFSLGVLTEAELTQCGMQYEESDDKFTAHYRYGAFCEFLKRTPRPMDAALADALYELGAADPNRVMGASMMTEIVNLPECPPEVLKKALCSGWKHLAKIVQTK
ncbi:MAG: hypothetical protein ABIY70_21730 [Capsulimonas sp.]|uniref:hypothetical protein n=1 Tax=Capsulimonas sp. TaxID=2494211 RepID=UPI0032634D55